MKSRLITLCLIVLLATVVYAEGQIDIAYSPFTISQSGSYIVVKDLSADTNQNCITVTCENVSIDLNGHTLYGAGTAAGYMGDGIYVNNHNTSITNGRICNFRSNGININFVRNASVTKVAAFGNGIAGISAFCYGGIIKDNIAEYNVGDGIACYDSVLVQDNIARYNNGNGIYVVYYNLVKDNVITNNKQDGIYADSGNQIIGNNIVSNYNGTYGRGIYVNYSGNRIDSNNIVGNRIGIYFADSGNWYGRNTFSHNSGGITAGSPPSDPGSPYNNQNF